jgi:uncharacterized protein YyaL (SSP411 family)
LAQGGEVPSAEPAPGSLRNRFTLDWDRPTQEQFRGWPPDDLLERPYWNPWQTGVFNRAALVARPVLFVMATRWNLAAQQSLSGVLADSEVLKVVNRAYVSVLVNADRRPEIKERYQTGSWPVVALLLPNGLPMLTEVQNPEASKPITIGQVDTERMLFLLQEGDKYWKLYPAELHLAGLRWAGEEDVSEPDPGAVDEAASDQVARRLLGNADQVAGGFGAAPKFVIPGLIEYASLRRARQRPDLYDHSLFTVGQLIGGPLYDARDGGVHRMATRPLWDGIQYEKLLSVNTALVRDLTFGLREQPGHPLVSRSLEHTCAFIVRVLSRPERGFYLAQSADGTSEDGGGYWRSEGENPQPPPIDPLVLSGPNALAGAALVRAGLILGNEALVQAGRGALDLVATEGYSPGRGVRHVLEPNPGNRFYLTAQADAALGLIDGYETLGEPRYLELARDIADTAWINLAHENEALLRDYLPGPTPAGLLARPRHPLRPNVRLARAMIRLDVHGAGATYRERAGRILEAISGDLGRYGLLATELALAVEEYIRRPLVVHLPGGNDPAAVSLRTAAALSSWPWTVAVTGTERSEAGAEVVWRDRSVSVESAEELAAAITRVTREE